MHWLGYDAVSCLNEAKTRIFLFIYLFYCTGQTDELMMPRGQICPNQTITVS